MSKIYSFINNKYIFFKEDDNNSLYKELDPVEERLLSFIQKKKLLKKHYNDLNNNQLNILVTKLILIDKEW